MKKLIFGLIATVFMVNLSWGQKDVKDGTKPPTTVNEVNLNNQLKDIHIQFGRKSKDCGGFGICVFTIDITIDDIIDLIQVIFKNKSLEISLNEKIYNKNKSKFIDNQIVLEEDFIVDLTTSKALGYSKNIILKAGKYTLNYDQKTKKYNCSIAYTLSK